MSLLIDALRKAEQAREKDAQRDQQTASAEDSPQDSQDAADGTIELELDDEFLTILEEDESGSHTPEQNTETPPTQTDQAESIPGSTAEKTTATSTDVASTEPAQHDVNDSVQPSVQPPIEQPPGQPAVSAQVVVAPVSAGQAHPRSSSDSEKTIEQRQRASARFAAARQYQASRGRRMAMYVGLGFAIVLIPAAALYLSGQWGSDTQPAAPAMLTQDSYDEQDNTADTVVYAHGPVERQESDEGFSVATAPITTEPVEMLDSTPAPQHATPAMPVGTTPDTYDTYGPVQPGESLWRISRRVKPESLSLLLMSRIIFAANPHAFMDDDPSLLSPGVMLQIPLGAQLEEYHSGIAEIPWSPQPGAVTSPHKMAIVEAVSPPSSQLAISRRHMPTERTRMELLAHHAYQQGELAKAEQIWREILREHHRHRGAMFGMAAVAVQRNDSPAAQSIYLQLLEWNPQDPVAHSALLALAPSADLLTRESHIKQLLAKHPQAAPLHLALGNTHAEQQRWQDAQQSYFTALQMHQSTAGTSTEAAYAHNLAISLEQLGKPREALVYYQLALELTERFPGVNTGIDKNQLRQHISRIDGLNP